MHNLPGQTRTEETRFFSVLLLLIADTSPYFSPPPSSCRKFSVYLGNSHNHSLFAPNNPLNPDWATTTYCASGPLVAIQSPNPEPTALSPCYHHPLNRSVSLCKPKNFGIHANASLQPRNSGRQYPKIYVPYTHKCQHTWKQVP